MFRYVPQEPFDTPKDAHDWLTATAEDWQARDGAKWAVSEANEEAVAGAAALTPQWDHRRAELAVLLAKPYWGNGYAGECAMALTRVAFEELDFEVVTLGHAVDNDRSRSAVESFVEAMGGQHDGLERNATVRGDGVVDAHNYSVTREQFLDATGE